HPFTASAVLSCYEAVPIVTGHFRRPAQGVTIRKSCDRRGQGGPVLFLTGCSGAASMNADSIRASDAAVVARYLQLRTLLHDRHLARVERLILDRYVVQATKRVHPTLPVHVRTGFVRPGEGELWP